MVDTHCHILDSKLKDRAEEIVENLSRDGVDFIVEISADPREAREGLDFARKHERVYCTIGVHPNYADTYSDEFEQWALKQTDPKIIAYGECGLDYFHKMIDIELQREVFKKQIIIADKLKLPLVIHCRDAYDDVQEILREHKEYLNNGVLIHCFSGTADDVKRFMEFDAYFAFGGAITFKNNYTAETALIAVSIDRLLLETDCPYLSPEPLRGKINEPKNIRHVALRVTSVLDLTFDEVNKITSENARRFFKV